MNKKEKEHWEIELWKLYEKLNEEHFGSSIYAQRIRVGKFMMDMTPYNRMRGRITWGLFLTDGQAKINEIIVNQFLFKKEYLEHFGWLPEIILHHELSHAMVALNTHPVRNGVVVCDQHGPEWQQWMNLHPNARAADYALRGHLADVVLKDMYRSFAKFCERHKDKELVLKWNY